MKTTVLLMLYWVTCCRGAVTPSMQFDHHVSLVDGGVYDMYWSIINGTAIFELHVKTLGYVGFGLSRTGGMAYADIVIGWVKDGKVYFQDRYSIDTRQPDVDDQQDWKLLEGREEGGYTILMFYRALTNCDVFDVDITDETMKIIYAFHPDDPKGVMSVKQHGMDRGHKSMLLINHEAEKSSDLPEDAFHVDITGKNITVPARETTYYCVGIKLPELDTKHHVIRVDPIVQPGHEGIVHHMVAYSCSGEVNETSHDGMAEDCDADSMEVLRQNCTSAVFTWATGGGSFNMPEDVGFPMGGNLSITFLKLEIHYDNPAPSKLDLVDTSGLRIWLTPTLRRYDAWMFTTGMVVRPYQAIPPHFAALKHYGHCPNKCLKNGLDMNGEEDLKIFSVILHTHLLGTALTLRHVRDGKELPPVIKDEYYDPSFQTARVLPQPVSIKATDELILECTYNSETKTNITFGGLATRDEMCLAFVMYYPRLSGFNFCYTMPLPVQTLAYADLNIKLKPPYRPEDFEVIGPKKYAGKNFTQILYETDWTDIWTRARFQQALDNPEMAVFLCDSVPELHFAAKPPEIEEHYEEEVDCKGFSGVAGSPSLYYSLRVLVLTFIIATIAKIL